MFGCGAGYAWGENVGYIDFDDVSIDEDGYFLGYASNGILGQVSFNCSNEDSCTDADFKVRTDWRPVSTREVEEEEEEEDNNSGGGRRSGGGGTSLGLTRNAVPKETKVEAAPVRSQFVDTEESWAQSYIEAIVEMGIASGVGDQKFEPDRFVTRAEFLKMTLQTAFLLEVRDQVSFEQTNLEGEFSDVQNTDWFAGYVNFAKAEGIINGYNDQTFRPNGPISREEALKIICVTLGLNHGEEAVIADFSDVDRTAWYSEYVDLAFELGLVKGYEDGTFGVGRSITRAETAKILVEAMGR